MSTARSYTRRKLGDKCSGNQIYFFSLFELCFLQPLLCQPPQKKYDRSFFNQKDGFDSAHYCDFLVARRCAVVVGQQCLSVRGLGKNAPQPIYLKHESRKKICPNLDHQLFKRMSVGVDSYPKFHHKVQKNKTRISQQYCTVQSDTSNIFYDG